jgi:hypothetical protein
VQRVAVDSESCRCSGLHALALTQDLQNQLFFYDVDHLIIDVGAFFADLRETSADKVRAERLKVF